MWFPTMYKRLYWAGYRGNFVGLTWYGNESGFLRWYDGNVFNAMEQASRVATFLQSLASEGTVNVVAHSLGNMIVSKAIELSPPGTVRRYVLAEAAVPSGAYDKDTPMWDYLWDPGEAQYRNALPRFTGEPGEDRSIAYALEVLSYETIFEAGMLNLKPWQLGTFGGYGPVLPQDDVWADYFAPILNKSELFNTWSGADEVLGPDGVEDAWPWNEAYKTLTVEDDVDEGSAPPHSVEQSWLAYRFPARRRATGNTPFVLVFNENKQVNTLGLGVYEHSDMKDRPLQILYDFFTYLNKTVTGNP